LLLRAAQDKIADKPSKDVLMPADLISLDEASWRLEKSGISRRALTELLLTSDPVLLGLLPGKEVPDLLDVSRVANFRAEPENVVIAGDIRWTGIKLDWRAFERRGRRVSWWFACDITREMIRRAGEPALRRRSFDDPRAVGPFRHSGPAAPRPSRRASQEWFADADYTGFVPSSREAPRGRRGPRSGKRENAAAAMRKDVSEKSLTVASLKAMPEKTLAGRYGVSRDTARKARFDALESFVENSNPTFDK
jgi:hypothetical protein